MLSCIICRQFCISPPDAKKGSELDSTLPFFTLVAGAWFELMTFTAELMKSEPDELFYLHKARFAIARPVQSSCGPSLGRRPKNAILHFLYETTSCSFTPSGAIAGGDVLKMLSCLFSDPSDQLSAVQIMLSCIICRQFCISPPDAKKGSELDSTLPFFTLVAGAWFELMTFTAELMKSEPDELFYLHKARFAIARPVQSSCGPSLGRRPKNAIHAFFV